MARGQQKLQSQAKAAEKMNKMKKQQGHSATEQKKAAQKALVHVCAVCKVCVSHHNYYSYYSTFKVFHLVSINTGHFLLMISATSSLLFYMKVLTDTLSICSTLTGCHMYVNNIFKIFIKPCGEQIKMNMNTNWLLLQAQMPDPKTYKQHFENKHPKNELPEDLKSV